MLLEAKLARAGRKSARAEAIRYALTRWKGLTWFLDVRRVELDSNAVERTIRPLALNRKNALFAGSVHGTVITSLIETAKLNDVDPQTWLADTLTRLPPVTAPTQSRRPCSGTTAAPWPEHTAYTHPQSHARLGSVTRLKRRHCELNFASGDHRSRLSDPKAHDP